MPRDSKRFLKRWGVGRARAREAPGHLRPPRLLINLRGSLIAPPEEAPAPEAASRDRRQPGRAPRVRNQDLTSAQFGGFSDDSGRQAEPGCVPAAFGEPDHVRIKTLVGPKCILLAPFGELREPRLKKLRGLGQLLAPEGPVPGPRGRFGLAGLRWAPGTQGPSHPSSILSPFPRAAS